MGLVGEEDPFDPLRFLLAGLFFLVGVVDGVEEGGALGTDEIEVLWTWVGAGLTWLAGREFVGAEDRACRTTLAFMTDMVGVVSDCCLGVAGSGFTAVLV